MKIAFACMACGKRFEVDAAHAGRKARCKGCGGVVTVPSAAPPEDQADEGGLYELQDPPPEVVPAAPSAFIKAPADPERMAKKRKAKARSKAIREAKAEVAGFAAKAAPILPRLLGGTAALAVVLGLIAAIAPHGTLIAACILLGLGMLMVLAGYGWGAFSAFAEDGMHGMLYLFFPIYTAYYLVANLDEAWRCIVLMAVGAGLVTLGGMIALSKLEEGSRVEPVPREQGRASSPAGPPLLAFAVVRRA